MYFHLAVNCISDSKAISSSSPARGSRAKWSWRKQWTFLLRLTPIFVLPTHSLSVDHTPPRIRLDRIRRFPSLKSFHVLVVFWLKYCPLTVVCIIDGGHDRGVGSPEGGAWEYSPSSITLSHYHIITSSALSKYHNIDQNTPKMWNNSSCNIHTEFLCEKYHTIWPVSKIPQTIITPKSRKPKFSLSQLKVL